jgi:putative membrane protein
MKNISMPLGLWAASALPLAAQGREDGYGQMYDHPHMWGGGGPAEWMGPVFMLLLLVLAVVGIVAIVRGYRPGVTRQSGADNAMATLRDRFAKGEIDAEDFNARKSLLSD